jgi:MOSC domain-containing protein YiiM
MNSDNNIKVQMKMEIVSIATSKKKGTQKITVDEAFLKKEHGLEGDAHAGTWHEVTFGDFAENIATTGVDWKNIPVGSRVRLGQHALVEITQIGKECHNRCAIYYKAGDCIMPREGVFARVLEEGKIRCGDSISIEEHSNE